MELELKEEGVGLELGDWGEMVLWSLEGHVVAEGYLVLVQGNEF